MLRQVRAVAVARIAAALAAVTLTGVPRVLALHAPAETHRCSCRANAGSHHECECAICRKAALAAQASDERAPPCHRAAARQALSRGAPPGSREAPCFEGTCGGAGRAPMTFPGVEPFCLPVPPAVRVTIAPPARAVSADPVRDRALEPETPPPRAG
jgi:hypothetical protein